MNNLSEKLGNAMNVVFEVIDCDLIRNQDECNSPTGLHEIAKKDDGEIVCIHCLKKFKIAKNFKGSFFDS